MFLYELFLTFRIVPLSSESSTPGLDTAEEGTMILRNVGNCSPDDTVSWPRSFESSSAVVLYFKYNYVLHYCTSIHSIR